MTFAFNLSLAGYLTALLFSAANLFSKRGWFASSATVFLAGGVVAQSVYMAARWFAAGRAPFSNMFESMVLFAWAMVVVYLALQVRHRIPVLGAATALLAVVTLAYASTFETKIQPLMPALRSNWLTFHVFTAFLGYGGFAIAALTGVGYLIASRTGQQRASRCDRGIGCRHSQDHLVWFSVSHRRHHFGCGLGEFRMGHLLELGPERNLVVDHVVHLRRLSALPFHAGMEGQARRMDFDHRLCLGHFHLLWRELPAEWVSQLCEVLTNGGQHGLAC